MSKIGKRQVLSSLFAIMLLIIGLSAPLTTSAADHDGRWGVGLEAGYMKLTEGYWDYSNVDLFAGISVNRGISHNWTLQAAFKYGFVRPAATTRAQDVGFTFDSGAPLYTVITQPTIKLHYYFAPESVVSPWIGFGGGITMWKVVDGTGQDVGLFPDGETVVGYNESGENLALEGNDLTFCMELGLDWNINNNLALNIGGRYNLMPGNEIDNTGMSWYWGADYVAANTALMEGFVGLTWWFGSDDYDGDGIANKDDRCPEKAEDMDGFEDLDGCPEPDNDNDRILDEDDKCPLEPEDYDGFQDEDGCPDPDNDQDGIIDSADDCPDEAEDMDGFQDEDGCPEADNDNDGVLDAADNCPDTPTGIEVDENGCPIVEEIKETLILKGVTFLSGSAQLTAESVGVLVEVSSSLKAWPKVRIEVRGHIDSTGSAEGNRDLSHRRALSVRDSLIQMGITPSRITAIGYGADFPIADNATRAGRAENRRVEISRIN